MRYLIATFVIVGLLTAGTAYAARFDFILGEPSVVEDSVIGDTLEQSRFDFTLGEPDIVFDATATETDTSDGIIFRTGGAIINNGGVIIR